MRTTALRLLATATIVGPAGAGVAIAEEGPASPEGDCAGINAASFAGAACTQPISSEASTDEIFAAIFGTKPPPAPTLEYPVQLIGMNRGDVKVTPASAPEQTMIDRRAIVDLLLPILNQEMQTQLLRTFTDRPEVSAADLTSIGLPTSFSDADLTLVVDVPLEHRSTVPIPMQQRYLYPSSDDVIKQAKTSAIVNLFAGTTYTHSSPDRDTGFTATEATVEAAFNHRGLVLETGMLYSDSPDSGQSVSLSDTRLTYDFTERMIRAEAGDLTVPTSGLQGNPGIAGISAYREFRLKPETNYRANPSQEFELQRSARVSVYINGQFVRDFRLMSGRYNLTDLPLRSGSGNDVVLEIQYDTGEIERVVFTAFYDFELLKKDTSEFAFSAGPRSEVSENERRYDTDNIAASGYYRLGVSDRLTVGANGQFDKDLYNVGAEAVYASPIGVVGTTLAHSDHDLGAGSAATVFYRWNSTDDARQLRANLQARFQDREYRTLGTTASAPFEYDVAGRISGRINKKSRFQAAAGYRRYYTSPNEEISGSLSGSYDIGSGSLTTTVSYFDDGIEPEWFFGLSYSMRIGSFMGQAAHDTRDRSTRASLSYQPDISVGSYGYDIAYTNQPTQEELQAGIGYVGNRFDGRIEQNFRKSRRGQENVTNLFLGSALVYADGRAALSRPVYDSFAMFEPRKDSGDFDIAVDPIGGLFGVQSGYSAHSSIFGPAVLSDMQSYYNRTVAVEAPEAPAGISIGNDVFTMRPGFRSGFSVDVGSDRNVAVMGRLVYADGRPVKYASGYAITEDGERLPVFSNAGGRFYVDGVKGGETIRIEFRNPKSGWIELKIPEKSIGVLRLEEDVLLNLPPKAPPQKIASLQTERGN